MATPRHPLRLNVGFLIYQSIGVSRDFSFDFPELTLEDDTNLKELRGTARISRTPQGLLVQAEFQGQVELECVRCLEPYQQGLNWSFTELYAFDHRSVTDSGLILPEDAHIDLGPLVRDFALIEVPINPLCKPDCKGLCPECGENLNQRDCGHRRLYSGSAFNSLNSFLDK